MHTTPNATKCAFLETQNRSDASIVVNALDEIVMAAACLYAVVEDARDRDKLPEDLSTLSLLLGALTANAKRINAVMLPKGSVDPEEVYADSQMQSWYPTMREAQDQKEKYRQKGLLMGVGMATYDAKPHYHLFSPTPQTSYDMKFTFKANEFVPALDVPFVTMRNYYESIPESLRIFK